VSNVSAFASIHFVWLIVKAKDYSKLANWDLITRQIFSRIKEKLSLSAVLELVAVFEEEENPLESSELVNETLIISAHKKSFSLTQLCFDATMYVYTLNQYLYQGKQDSLSVEQDNNNLQDLENCA